MADKKDANPFAEYQKKYFELWKDSMSKIPGAQQYQEMLEKATPDFSEYWKGFSSSMPGFQFPGIAGLNGDAFPGVSQWWEQVSSMMPDLSSFMKAPSIKIPGFESYAKVYDLWRGMSNPAEFAASFQEKYLDLMQDLVKGFMPEGASAFMERPMQLMDTLVNYYNVNFAPLLQIDDEIMQRIAKGDLSAYTDFFRSFNEKYEETIGKYYNIAGLGLNRESNEDLMKAMSAYNKAMFATGELMSMIMTTGAESAAKLANSFQEAIKDGKVPTTFREFYDLWSSVTEQELVSMLDTDEFSKTFDYFADMYSRYIAAQNKVVERSLASLPIPTNTDMKSLYKTVYDLRKEVRDLKREIKALKEAKSSK